LRSFTRLRIVIGVRLFKALGGSPKYASPRSVSTGNALHDAGVRTSDRLDGGDPVGFGELKFGIGTINEIYFELSESFASNSPFAENMFRE